VIRFTLLLILQTIATGSIFSQIDTGTKSADSALQKKTALNSLDSPVKKTAVIRASTTTQRRKTDSLPGDSSATPIQNDTSWMVIAAEYPGRDFNRYSYEQNKYFAFGAKPLVVISDRKEFKGKEILFYALLAVLLVFAFIRVSFPKYINDLFRVAFRTTLKQRQISEQLIQTPLPSLLLNFFFLLVASMYVSFVLEHYQLSDSYNFWLLSLYCLVALTVIYVIKFLSLKFFVWLFNITPTTDGYIFIVFMINKIVGIYLLPFIIMLAFAEGDVYQVAFALSYIGIFALLAYRFILSYGLARSQIRVNPFHFFLYLCAFEIVPLLLIYEALTRWF